MPRVGILLFAKCTCVFLLWCAGACVFFRGYTQHVFPEGSFITSRNVGCESVRVGYKKVRWALMFIVVREVAMTEKFPITPEGYGKLREELELLKNSERPSVIRAIAEARAQGDLSENAEYSAAKERQGLIESKISDLEHRMTHAEIIEYRSTVSDHVQFGAEVLLTDPESGKQVTYRIVGEYEADLAQKMISVSSPLARALLGKIVGDEVEVNTPKGTKYYTVLSIKY